METEVLKEEYVTLREAVDRLCKKGIITNAANLRAWLWYRGIETHKIGQVHVVRESDLVGYMPRHTK